MLTFFFAPGSSSMAPHIALHEVGAPFEPRPVSFHARGTHTPDFLAMNPDGKVPVLLIDGRTLTEVAGILFYLARRFPRAGLLPLGDIEAEAQVVSWMSFIASALHPARRLPPAEAQAVWQVAEQRLGEGEWAVGSYSIADIHLFRLFWRFQGLAGLSGEAFPRLHAHRARMLARPAVRRVIAIEEGIGYQLPA
jgi:glutathione S-transferase